MVGVGLAVAWPTGSNVQQATHWVTLVDTDDLAVNEPVRFPGQRLWLVKLESGEVLALSQKSPHLGCTVTYRPEFEFEGHTGWFRDPCSGSNWDLTGVKYSGPAPRGLDRYQVRILGGGVQAHLSRLIAGPVGASQGREPVTPY